VVPAVLACAVIAAAGATAHGAGSLRVGLVLEQPLVGRADDPFQHSAYLGLARAVRTLHVQGRVVAPNPAPTSSYLPPISYLARQRYDLVIGIGFLEARDLDRAAVRFPALRFALLDAPRDILAHRPPNVEGTVFRTEQPSYLAGYLAARMVASRPGPHVVSAVGGIAIPPVKAYIAGFRAGAHRADPTVRTLVSYTNDFVNPAKCARAARAQIAQGSRAVFDVAGGCGVGALQVAKRRGVWGIGVDIDQSYLGPFVLTSVIKRLDVAVYDFVHDLQLGRMKTGGNTVFDLRNGGVGLGRFSPQVPPSLRRDLKRLTKEIVDRRIVVPAGLN
jgi:basic membrane protein A and related proteins